MLQIEVASENRGRLVGNITTGGEAAKQYKKLQIQSEYSTNNASSRNYMNSIKDLGGCHVLQPLLLLFIIVYSYQSFMCYNRRRAPQQFHIKELIHNLQLLL